MEWLRVYECVRGFIICVCVLHLHASWRSCPTGCVWAALEADSSPDLGVSSLEAQTHSNLWSIQFLSSGGEERRGEERRGEERRGEERRGEEERRWEERRGEERRGEERRGEISLVSEFFHPALERVTSSAHTYLILPWDGNAACSKFGVEVIVSLVQIYSLDRGELLYVQNILAVHCPRLGEGNDQEKDGVERRNRRQVYLHR